MRKKILTLIFSVLFILPSIFLLSACGKDDMCTITYNFNLGESVNSEIDSQLLSLFDKNGFSKQEAKIVDHKIILSYSKSIKKGNYIELYNFDDVGLSDYFLGWYVEDVKLNSLNMVEGDIEVCAKWESNLTNKLKYYGFNNYQYSYNETNLTAKFINANATTHYNGIGVIQLPELVIKENKFYKVTDIAYSTTRDDMVFYVPLTYSGRLSEPIVFPNEDVNDSGITYLGNYISIRSSAATYIYEANYYTNTAKMVSLTAGSFLSDDYYAVLNGNIKITRQQDQQRELTVIDAGNIYPGDLCVCTQFIISKSLTDYPTFWNVPEDDPITVLFEATREEVSEIDYTWVETKNNIISRAEVYYYSEIEPVEDGYNYWCYKTGPFGGTTVKFW